MKRVWSSFKSHPYVSNVMGYTTLFATADIIHQGILGGKQSQTDSQMPDLFMTDIDEQKSQLERTVHQDTTNLLHSIDWKQTARVAMVGFCFHANFNYHWLKALERMLPGGRMKQVTLKVALDQLIGAPATISAFFIGLSTLERRDDPLEEWRNKFWPSYKTGVVYWSTMQAVNFSLVPPVARTVFAGGISLVWTVFLCHFRHQK
ncbi:mpv17-like protein [Denticeps clupeoides]|uniref:mpv17-like protein n=1 Tax=Denticeps clupeoides TaxID=299321 RepID=UPI0010A47E6C|nr:mpv17-like protein [Denticeps clupeoides]